MSWTPISNTVPQYEEDGIAASGFYIKFYEAGTTTPTAMATDSTGVTTLDKCELNTEGYPKNGSNAVFIPHIDRRYKIALFRNATDADNNNLNNAVWPVDNMEPVLTEGSGEVATIADLRNVEPSRDGQQISLLGHTLAGIGGGEFYFDESDTTSADNNGTIIVTTGDKRWKRIVVDFVTLEMYGAIGDGTVNDTDAIQNCIDIENTIKGSPNKEYVITSILNVNGKTDFTFIADGPGTVFNVDAGTRLMNVSGDNLDIGGFDIKSAASTPITSEGIITINNLGVPSSNVLFRDILFDCPTHGMNAMLIKGNSPSGLVDGLEIKNCDVQNIGRMGIEILAQAENTNIHHNTINNTGLVSSIFGMGVSLSGDSLVESSCSNNNIGNCPFACIEVVGTQQGVKLHDNMLFGNNAALISNTNVPISDGLSIQGNVSEPGEYSIIKIHSSKDTLVLGNTFYVTRLDIATDGAIIRDNNIFSNQATAVIIDNHERCIVESNLVDNSASGSNNATIRCFNSGAVLNLISSNRIRKASGGSFVDNNSGATQNTFRENENADTLAPADDSPAQRIVADVTTNDYVNIALLGAPAGSSRRAGQFRITVSGTSNAGTDLFSGSTVVNVRMRDEVTAFSLISQDILYANNVTLPVTLNTGGFSVQALPGSGSGQAVTWFVEDLTIGLPAPGSIISMGFSGAP